MRSLIPLLAALAPLLTAPAPAAAQTSPAPPSAARDSVRLGTLVAEALRLDPRRRQLALEARASELRLANIDAERRPVLAVEGLTQYQSAVTTIPVAVPGITIPTPPNDTYDAHLAAQLSLFDPSLAARRAAERAQLGEAQASTRATLFTLRQEVSDAYFAVAVARLRLAEVDAAIDDLAARLRETVIRFREGAALPGDTASVAAALLQRRQDALQARASRNAALARLADLVGHPLSDSTPLSLGDQAARVHVVLAALDTLRARPEYQQFAATRDRIARQIEIEAAQERPRVSAFARLGYGRPGLNVLSRDFQSYWLGGVELHWTPWTWGTTGRDREVSALQREIATTNEETFTRDLRRGVEESIANIARLDSALALDDDIVALRERVDRETRIRLGEGVVTASEYVDRATELLTARLVRIQHRVELAASRSAVLTLVGVEVP